MNMIFLLNVWHFIQCALLSLVLDQSLLSMSHKERQTSISFNNVLTKSHNFYEKGLVAELISCESTQIQPRMWISTRGPYRVKLTFNTDSQIMQKSNVYTKLFLLQKTLVISASIRHYKDSTFLCTLIIKGLLQITHFIPSPSVSEKHISHELLAFKGQ